MEKSNLLHLTILKLEVNDYKASLDIYESFYDYLQNLVSTDLLKNIDFVGQYQTILSTKNTR